MPPPAILLSTVVLLFQGAPPFDAVEPLAQRGDRRIALQDVAIEAADDRATEILVELRTLKFTADTPLWCARLQELAGIGAEAVPAICAELDRTTDDQMLRQLGFVLRAIGDPRAVPALIRAIPKTLVPANSDFGMTVDDDDLLKFMQENDLNEENRGMDFGFGRSVREILGALHKLTRHDFDDWRLFQVHLRRDPRGKALQVRLFRDQSIRWQEWWEKNAGTFVSDKEHQQVGLPKWKEEPLPEPGLGKNPTIEGGVAGMVLSPPGETARYRTLFMDLDTGATPGWPKSIREERTAAGSAELGEWMKQNGVDLMAIEHKSRDGSVSTALQAIDMKVWEIDVDQAQRWAKGLDSAEIPDSKAGSGLLLHRDSVSGEYDPETYAAFLLETREGGYVILQVTDRITRLFTAEELKGGLRELPKGAGFARGVQFTYNRIAN